MTEKLDQLNAQLQAADQRLAELETGMQELEAQLTAKRNERAAEIVGEKDVEKIGKEIVSLQTKYSGYQDAREKQLETIRKLTGQRDSEKRAIGKTRAELAKVKRLSQEARIYSLLVDAAMSLPDLRKYRAEQLSALRMAGVKKQDIDSEGHRSGLLREALEAEIVKLLRGFPRSILADGKFPSPEEVRRSIK